VRLAYLSLSGFKRSVYTICWAPILRKRRCLSVHVVGVINRWCYLLGSSSHCHKHYSLFGSSCLLYGRRWDDSTQSLGAGIRFSVGVALSSHLFVLFLLFQLYEDLYDDNNTPKGVGVGCVWFAIDLSFLDVVFFLFFAFMRYLSLSP